MDHAVLYVLVIIGVALLFDFINGFHDSANSIATVVSTRVLSPGVAVVWAAFFNFMAAFVVGTAVAKTVGKGLIDPMVVDPSVVLGGLLGAILWDLITWFLGLPTSSSHALLGGYGGAAIAKAGFGALILSGWILPVAFIVLSPLLGMAIALGLTVGLSWLLRSMRPGPLDKVFRRLQLLSAALYSIESRRQRRAEDDGNHRRPTGFHSASIPEPAGLARLFLRGNSGPDSALGGVRGLHRHCLGTALGGWRIVKTMGTRITRLRPFGGFCAETAGGITVMIASRLGVPVSTTHTITGAIVGVGAAHRLSAVRWGVARRIVWAWVLTMPMSAAIAAVAYLILSKRV